MPRKMGKKDLTVAMNDTELEAVKSLARRRNFKITADYIRHLITEDAAKMGEAITFDVDRGGYRERDAESDGDGSSASDTLVLAA